MDGIRKEELLQRKMDNKTKSPRKIHLMKALKLGKKLKIHGKKVEENFYYKKNFTKA